MSYIVKKIFIPKSYRKVLVTIFLALTMVLIYSYLRASTAVYPDVKLLQNNFDQPHTKLGTVITDIKIIKCYYRNCKAPVGYSKIQPPMNYYETTVDSSATTKLTSPLYYIVIKEQPVDTATNILLDLTFDKPKDDAGFELIKSDNYQLYKKFFSTNIKNPIPSDLPLVHSLDLLFGSNDLIDSRVNHFSVHSSMTEEKIHPIISMFKLPQSKQDIWTQDTSQFVMMQETSILRIDESVTKFKVIQMSDLHFGQSLGRKCGKDQELCTSDLKTLKFMEDSIHKENPDLVVITGDLIDVDRSVDYKSIILKSLQPILQTNTKFIFTFGDEFDGQENLREIKLSLIKFLQTLPNCYNTIEGIDDSLHGVTNYNLKVIRGEKEVAHVTVFDSEDKYLDETQTNFLYRIHAEDPEKLFKLLFFHFPIPQFRPTGKFKIIGSYNEKHPLNSKTKPQVLDDIRNCGYQVVSVGHEHENDACLLNEKSSASGEQSIWLCYSSVAGDSGVTALDANYDRKLRVYEIDFEKSILLSWKRSEMKKKGFDYQLVYKFPSLPEAPKEPKP